MNLYLTAKKIHRLAIWTTTLLGVTQGFTGLNLKYGWINSPMILLIHAEMGVWFVITFSISMITGILMYTLLLPKKSPVTDVKTNP